ncbi:MAG: hypothetical protein HRS57_00815 [Mycoplasmataceae bacterium]|nr:hypothetical protein [Mycoplasmataceae bacterium]
MNRSIRSFISTLSLSEEEPIIKLISDFENSSNVNIKLPITYKTYFKYDLPNTSYESDISFYEYDPTEYRLFGHLLVNDSKIMEKSSKLIWKNLIIDSSETATSTYKKFIEDRLDKRSFSYSIYLFDFSNFISEQNMEESIYSLSNFKSELKQNKNRLISNISDSAIAVIKRKRHNSLKLWKTERYIQKTLEKTNINVNWKKDVYKSIVSSSNMISKSEIKYSMSLAKFNSISRVIEKNCSPIYWDDRKDEGSPLFKEYQEIVSNPDTSYEMFFKNEISVLERNIYKVRSSVPGTYLTFKRNNLVSNVIRKANRDIYFRYITEYLSKLKTKNIFLSVDYNEIIISRDYMNAKKLENFKLPNKNVTIIIENMPVFGFDHKIIEEYISLLKNNGFNFAMSMAGVSKESRKTLLSLDFDYVFINPTKFVDREKYDTFVDKKNDFLDICKKKNIKLVFSNVDLKDLETVEILKENKNALFTIANKNLKYKDIKI